MTAPDVGAREPEELVNAFWAEIELAHGVLGTRMTRGLIAARDALLAALAETREGWRDIATAPRDGTRILAWFHDDSPMRAYLGEHQSGISIAAWIDHNGGGWVANRLGTPTHWMPLPDAPPRPQPTEEVKP